MRSRNVFHPCFVFHRLVEYLFGNFDESNLIGFDFQIIYRQFISSYALRPQVSRIFDNFDETNLSGFNF
jgi:hypothetical protein